MPGDRLPRLRQGLALALGDARARFDEIDSQGRLEGRGDAAGAQEIGHQRAAAGTKLDEAERIGTPHDLPGGEAPDADQLAEDLATPPVR